MFKKALIVIGLILIIFVLVVASRPNEFRTERSATINAPASAVFTQVNDFHHWEKWSPWLDLDPNAKTVYEGPSAGTGAIFRWDGNNNVGAGSNTITESRPNEFIRIELAFLRPFEGVSTVEFTFKPQGEQTVVTWAMFGKNNFISKAMSLFMNCDKMVGDQFDKGLARLKSLVESSK